MTCNINDLHVHVELTCTVYMYMYNLHVHVRHYYILLFNVITPAFCYISTNGLSDTCEGSLCRSFTPVEKELTYPLIIIMWLLIYSLALTFYPFSKLLYGAICYNDWMLATYYKM